MSRGLEGLHPYLCELAIKLIECCGKVGIRVEITSTKRSKEEQERLYELGRTCNGSIVTFRKPGTSLHEYGYAFDIDCSTSTNDDNNLLRKVAVIAKDIGLYWGGTSCRDCDMNHFFWTGGLTLNEIKSGILPKNDGNFLERVSNENNKPAVIRNDLLVRRTYVKKTTLTDVTVRKLPTPTSEGVGIIQSGTILRTFSITRNGYIEIEFNGKRAFISMISLT